MSNDVLTVVAAALTAAAEAHAGSRGRRKSGLHAGERRTLEELYSCKAWSCAEF